jgi:lipopolysaccharide export system protein LptA
MSITGRGARGYTELKQATVVEDVTMVLSPMGRGGGKSQPVTITCDGPLQLDYEKHVAVFTRNVHVQDPEGDLYGDKLVAYLDPVAGDVRYAQATGHVRISKDANAAVSERAVYDPRTGKITLVGSPSLLLQRGERNGSVTLPTLSPLRNGSGSPAGGETAAPR